MISGAPETPFYSPPRTFSVGRILEGSLNVLFRNFVPFIAISALAGVPELIFSLAATKSSPANSWVQILLGLVLGAVCQAMIVYGTFQALRGRPVQIGQSLGIGLRRAIPVVGTSLASGIVIAIGFIVLVVPGLIAMTVFFVAEPACVVERLGPFESLGRSTELTRGYRWPVFGLAFVIGIVEVIIGAIIGAMLLHAGSLVAYAIVMFVWGALVRAYMSVLVAIVYHDLRVLKEGIDLDRIAAVFD